MFEIICVTNRRICEGDFVKKLYKLSEDENVSKIILREKDLTDEEYFALYNMVKSEKIIWHSHVLKAKENKISKIHMTYPEFLKYGKDDFTYAGVSVHSVTEAVNAEKNHADYIIAGHIFETDCKKGLTPRGIPFLEKVCENVSIPVYAIGGINPQNIILTEKAGAKGAAMMSYFMREARR